MSTLAVSHFNVAVEEMLDDLKTFLAFLPGTDSTLALVEAAERPVGVGAFSGNVERGPLAVLGMRGGRVEARVRFDVVAPTPADVATAARDLQKRVLNARLDPGFRDFLVLEPAGGEPANPFGTAWRESVEYRALYEYSYEDPEDAGGLIVSIPVELHGEHREKMAVTRDLTRWSAVEAPPLRIRGPRAIGTLTALAFKGAVLPTGPVTLAVTTEGAGPVTSHAKLDVFAQEVVSGGRNDEVVFTDVAALLEAFTAADDAVMLADGRGAPATYTPSALRRPPVVFPAAPSPVTLLAGVQLAGPEEVLEVRYRNPDLESDEAPRFSDGSTSVVYLRAGRGLSA